MSERMGYWLDYDHPYLTMSTPYIESVWWSLKTLFDRGLIEKGHYVLPYCPRCETTLSSHEVAQGYRDTDDPSVTVRFRLVGTDQPPRDLLVWTTTPWTLVSNVFVVARADLPYVVVRDADGSEVVLAEAAVPRYFSEAPTIVDRFDGALLEGREYRPPFSFVPEAPGRFRVVLDAMIDVKEGTGFVHGAPNFGPDDYRIAYREHLGTFDPLDSRGVFGPLVPIVEGRPFKAADATLTADLASRGLLYRSETVRHTYPFCYRCDTKLLYRAIDSWFLRTSRFSSWLVEYNATVTWVPAHLRDGRFGNFLTEAKDWALSRSRYWGTPLPVWGCAKGHFRCIGSLAELAEAWGRPLPEEFDPHRVGVDAIEFPCSTCGQTSRREPYTIDAWYDSGSSPFAQFHYPFEPGPFDPSAPLDYVSEAIDQTRGWFYALLVLSTALFDRPAFRAALVTGHGLDDVGRKMSKSKGNVTEPIDLLTRLGGDAVRWFAFCTDFTEGMRMDEAEIRSHAARTIGTLTNVVAFYQQNAAADGLAPVTDLPRPSSVLDRWLLSRLEATRSAVETSLERFDPRPGAQALRSFVDELSTWYLRRSRPRFWADPSDPARHEAHATLSYTLATLSRILAPFLPFTAEWVAQHFVDRPFSTAETSVHLARWPGELPTRDHALEEGMEAVRSLVEVGRELRQRAGVKSRIPLLEFVVFGDRAPALGSLGPEANALIANELNVRTVRFVTQGETSDFPETDWIAQTEGDQRSAALSRRPTAELLREGLVREVLRRLQQRRKELHLAFTDRVDLVIGASSDLAAALEEHRPTLERELLTRTLSIRAGELPSGAEVQRWEFEGTSFSAQMARAAAPTTPRRRSRPAPGRRRRPERPRRRPRPRTARPVLTRAAKRSARARPSRRSARGTPRHPTPPRRRPGGGAARSRPRPRRSARPVRRRPRPAGPRHRRRRSVRAR
jgi:isoleucyl-tRNA synthetase